MKKTLFSLFLVLFVANTLWFSTIVNQTYASSFEYDFSASWDYTLSNTSKINILWGDAKLTSTLSPRGNLENGPSAMDRATNVYIDGNYAYVWGNGSHAITIVDISDPTNPTQVWYLWAASNSRMYGIYDLVKSGNYLYIAARTWDSLVVVDVSNPANPTYVDRVTKSGTTIALDDPRWVDVSWNFVYVASYNSDSLQVIDISTPTNPTPRGNIINSTRLNGATSVKVSGNYAYVTSYLNDRVQVIDISDPDSLSFADQIIDSWVEELNGAWGIDIVWNTAYVTAYIDDWVEILDISTPTAITSLWRITNAGGRSLNGPRGIEVIWNNAYIAAYADDALQILDISTPASITPVGRLDTASTGRLDAAFGVAVSGTDVFVTSYTHGSLQSIDTSTPSTPVFQGELLSGPVKLWNPVGIAVANDKAYVSAYGWGNLEIIDVADTSAPSHLGSIQDVSTLNELYGAWDVEIIGNYAYVSAYGDDGIEVVDISTPTAPVWVTRILRNNGTIELDNPRWMDVQGDFLYVAVYNRDALQIIDVSTPSSPVARGFVRDTSKLNGANDVVVSGNYAYVANYNADSMTIINISDPDNPSIVFEYEDNATNELNGARGIAKWWDLVYVAWYVDDWIEVIDVSDPSAPTKAWEIQNSGSIRLNGPRWLWYDKGYLYSAQYADDSILVYDVSDGGNPIHVTEIRNTTLYDTAQEITKLWNDLLFTTYLWSSLGIVREVYQSDSPFVVPNTAVADTVIYEINEELWEFNEWDVTFQLSNNNGTTWYYFDGTSWVTTVWGTAQSNSSTLINANISWFNALGWGTGQIKWKAFLNSDGTQKVEIYAIYVETEIPSPGDVSTDLSLWLKADTGTSTTTDGAALTTWDDQSGNTLDATAVVTPNYLNNDTDSVNYNPVVDFNGTDDYMRNLANGVHSDSYFLVIVPDQTIDGIATGGVPFSFDCLSGTLSSGTCWLSFAWVVLGQFTAAMPDEVVTHTLWSSVNWRSAEWWVSSYPSGKPMLLSVNENSGNNGTDIFQQWLQTNNTSANTYQTLTSADYGIGRSMDNTYPFYYDGKIAEVINYSGRVGDSDRQKIESYLGIKYGMTLNSGTQNYSDSEWDVFWNTSTAGTHIYNIFWVWRDDSQELWQVKSKSVNDDAVLLIEAEDEGTNISNSFVDIENKEFLTIAHDNESNSWTATGKPAGYDILTRVWKVQEIWDIGTVSLEFDVGDSDFDIPAPNTGTDYYIVYDSDGDGSFVDETPTILTNTSGNLWEISGFNPKHNHTFTLATQESTNNIPTDISLSSSDIDENSSIWANVGTLSTTDADVADTHTYTLVSWAGDDDNSFFSISGGVLSLDHSADFEIRDSYTIRIQTDDGNGGTYQESFPISVNNLVEVLSSSLDFENTSNAYKYTVTSWSWNRTTTNPYEGSYSMESDNGGVNNSQSCFEVTHTRDAVGSVDFYYEVSSQSGSDFLKFYIDNVEQQTWSGTIPYVQHTESGIAAGTHDYKWCYIKDNTGSAGTDSVFVDLITFPTGLVDNTPPDITATSFASGSLLPWGNHDIAITYNDPDSGIDISSASMTLNKWDGVSAWWGDISGSGLGSPSITSSWATYPMNNLGFGKYRYNFSIDDNATNTSSTWAIEFYIDEPEFIVGSGSIDIGDINDTTEVFSGDVTITVKTVGAAFETTMENPTSLIYTTETVGGWNGTTGYWYEQSPFTATISPISSGTTIGNESQNINTDGNKNTYIYTIRFWAKVDPQQPAWEYEANIDFDVHFSY